MEGIKVSIALALVLSMIAPLSGEMPVGGADGSVFIAYEVGMNVSAASHFSFIGNSSGQSVGSVMSRRCGDINGDGYDDLVIGYPNDDYDLRGRVQILFGGDDMMERPDNRTESDVVIRGELDYSEFGSLVSIVGDLNGDSMDDLAIVSGQYYDGHYGRLYVFLGRTVWNRTYSGSEADGIVSGDNTIMEWGDCLEGVGDINGDGLEDIGVSDMYSSGAFSFCGKVFILFGRTSDWPDGDKISDVCDASFEGYYSYQYLGYTVCGPGDINGDGYDDLVASSYVNHSYAGTVYIVLGRASGWETGVSISECDAVIFGEESYDYFGFAVSGYGDLDNDGFNDFAVSAMSNDEGAYNAGKVYVFRGRQNWPACLEADSAYLQIVGEVSNRAIGCVVSIVPDLNADGLADLLMGAAYYDHDQMTYCGVVHVFYGNPSLHGTLYGDDCDASFVGESSSDFLGETIAIVGDLTGGGYRNVAISSPWNDEGSYNAGKIYVLGYGRNNDPLDITSMKVFSDPDYSRTASVLDIGETAYIEVRGTDGNSSTRDLVLVNLTANLTHTTPVKVNLLETGADTGIYQGKYIVRQFSYGETMTLVPSLDPSKACTLRIDTPVRISPLDSVYALEEGTDISVAVRNLGYYTDPVWDYNDDAEWLDLDPETGTISGSPDNGDVGSYKANITIRGCGRTDFKAFSIKVKNVAPTIVTNNTLCAEEDSLYSADYACSEDGEPGIAWRLSTDAMWLRIDQQTGVLSGTPSNDDLGDYYVKVIVDDGNGGTADSPFNLSVVNVNDPPVIDTEDVTTVDQGTRYVRVYSATDTDPDESLSWALITDAPWLSLEGSTISGTPGPSDVGTFSLNVSVMDRAGRIDTHEFYLVVKNVNDAPSFSSFPADQSVICGSDFTFDVDVADPDWDAITYTIKTVPISDMTIDEDGVISWTATDRILEEGSDTLLVQVTASDGSLKAVGSFSLKIVMTAPPLSTLMSPEDQSRIRSTGSKLSWSGSDPEGAPLTYDIYLSPDMASVLSLEDSARYVKGYTGNNLPLTTVAAGSRYYWTVIPNDGGRYGTCGTGVRSFTVNYPPTIMAPEIPDCSVGSEFKLRLTAKDLDLSDASSLRFSLVEGPEGMTVSSNTGLIRWTPGADQAMLHEVTINVTDGMEEGSVTFVLEVQEGASEEGGSLLPIIFGTAVALAVAGAVAAVLVIRKRGKVQEGPEETVIGAVDDIAPPRSDCAVSTDINEAHASDHADRAPKTYEELYGAPAPTREDALTTVELRDYIRKEIETLEEM